MRGHLRAEGGPTISGEIENVSLRGIFFHAKDPPQPGLRCEVWIELDGSDQEVIARGRVVRTEATGCAVELDEIVGLESFEHLQNLVLFNAADPAQVHRELGAHLGLVPKDPEAPFGGS